MSRDETYLGRLNNKIVRFPFQNCKIKDGQIDRTHVSGTKTKWISLDL